MNKQLLLFADWAKPSEQKYSTKIEAPVYEPRHNKPHLLTLCDLSKVKALIREIDASDLPEDEKAFLRAAA